MNRSAGILLPVSSLPSKYGIGDFGKCAYDFVDWLKEAGQSYWQILPLVPTSYGDSPYQSISTFAGNLYFIDLEELIEEGQDYLKEDQKLHTRIAQCTGNRVLPILIPVVTYSVHLFGKMTQKSMLQETIDVHAAIVDAIANHEPEKARDAMHQHLRYHKDSIG